jgi:hypothetical protein
MKRRDIIHHVEIHGCTLAEVWVDAGADEIRGWKSSQVCVFVLASGVL